MSTYEERANHIAALERRNRDLVARSRADLARHEAAMAAINAAMQAWADAVAAPWRAFAEEIRRDMHR